MSTEKERAYNKAWRARNRDNVVARKRRDYIKHRERILEQNKEWRDRNIDAVRAQKREYAKSNGARVKAASRRHYEVNKEVVLDKCRQYYARTREQRLVSTTAYREKNRDVINARIRAWRENNKELVKDKRLKKQYGIGIKEVREMLANQGFMCPICSLEITEDNRHIDHDHLSGNVRALLCGSCNVMIGYAKESKAILKAAIAYLEVHNG